MGQLAASVAPSARVPSLRRTAIGIIPVSAAVQVCSFASSIALAQMLGASAATDAYFLGLSIPVLAYAILLAAVRLGAIPALTDVEAGDPARLSSVASDLFSVVLVASVLLAVVTSIAAAGVLPLLIGDPQVASMTRWVALELAPLGVLGALAGALGAILAVKRRFVAAVAVMALEPVVKTVLTVALADRLGINALILGNLVGSAGAVLILLHVVRRSGIRIHLRRPQDSRFVRGLIALSAPLLIGQSVLQANPLIDRTMATVAGSGSVTALELGLRLFSVPTTLLTATLIGPIAATWAARYAEGGWLALRGSASRAISAAAVGIPPIVVIGLFLRHDVISMVYRGGAYSGKAVDETTSVFGMLLLGLPAQVLVVVYSTLFVVRKDAITPMRIACANVVLNVGLNFALRPFFGVAGIALSTSLTFTILVIAYGVVAHRRWGSIVTRAALTVAVRAGVAAAASSVATLGLLEALPSPESRLSTFVVIVVVAGATLGVYAAVFFGNRLPIFLSGGATRSQA